MTAGMKLFHCPRIITRAGSLWRAEETREGRVGEINGMQITLSARRESRDMKETRLVGQTEFIYQAEATAKQPGVNTGGELGSTLCPGWISPRASTEPRRVLGPSVPGLTSPAVTQVLTARELRNSRVIRV